MTLITVNSEFDTIPPEAGITTLREALQIAQGTPGADRIEFDLPAGTIIELDIGKGPLVIASGEEVVIDGDVDGNGIADITIDGSGWRPGRPIIGYGTSLFEVEAGADATLAGLDMTYAYVVGSWEIGTGEDGAPGVDGADGMDGGLTYADQAEAGEDGSAGEAGQNGGTAAAITNRGTLTLDRVVLLGNDAFGGAAGHGGNGGDGGDGGRGAKGYDAYGYCYFVCSDGEDGYSGAAGGVGGAGGSGGMGGNAGTVLNHAGATLFARDSWLTSTNTGMGEPNFAQSGKGGDGGIAGQGGDGGDGGAGGDSYDYSVSILRDCDVPGSYPKSAYSYCIYDADNDFFYETVYYTLPGGSQGPGGAGGNAGAGGNGGAGGHAAEGILNAGTVIAPYTNVGRTAPVAASARPGGSASADPAPGGNGGSGLPNGAPGLPGTLGTPGAGGLEGGALLNIAGGTGTLAVADTIVYLHASDLQITEGTGGTSTALLHINRLGDDTETVIANWQVSGGTADGADFLGGLPSGTVTFTPGGPDSQAISFDIVADSDEEPDETFSVALTSLTDDPGGAATAFGTASVSGEILNDDKGDPGINPPPPSNDPDLLVGTDGPDDIAGLGGEDTICGGRGNDVLRGDGDDDLLKGEAGDDLLKGNGGDDTLKGGTGDDTLVGNAGDDLLYGSGGNDRLVGATGNDRLNGGAGDNRLIGGAGSDTFIFATNATGMNTITDFDLSSDRLKFNNVTVTNVREAGGNALMGLDTGGTIKLIGVSAEAAQQALPAPVQNDWIQWRVADGGKGDDLLRGNAGNDSLKGEAGDDLLKGNGGDDTLKGGAGNDTIVGNAGDDRLYGGGGDDRLVGASGDDALNGGAGDNRLIGGTGADTFILASNATGHNTITDFDLSEDRLKFNNDVAATDIREVGGNAITDLNTGGSIKLVDVSAEAAQQALPAPVQNDWIQWRVADGGNGHWYRMVFESAGLTWTEANARAEAMVGGTAYLATTTSPDENAFVFENLVDDFDAWTDIGQGPYFGLIQDPLGAEPEGGWGWVTGEDLTFANWASGEPNDVVPPGEDFGQFGTPGFTEPVGTWNDVVGDNDEPIAFVVEVDSLLI